MAALVRTAPVLAALLAATACGADKTALLIEVSSSDLSAPQDLDALRFVVVSTTGRRIDETYAIEGPWPHSLAVLPSGDADGSVRITVTGLLGGAERVRRVVEASFERGASRRVFVTLSGDCVGLSCPEGVDCVAGRCVLDEGDAGSDAGSLDGGLTRTDAGPPGMDAGPPGMDAGPPGMDAGPPGMDAGPPGTDAGPPGMDAGPPVMDAGAPGTDAGPPGMDAGPPVMDAGAPDGGMSLDDGGLPPARALYFSEYVEGSSFNKALELYNPTSEPISLSGCSLQVFSNGSAAVTGQVTLFENIAPGDTFVLCNTSGVAELLPLCDRLVSSSSSPLAFNGDDAIALTCDGVFVDVIGQIGFDPGTRWGTTPNSTLDTTLRRGCDVAMGRVDGLSPFAPSTEWAGVGLDVFDGLGSRGCP